MLFSFLTKCAFIFGILITTNASGPVWIATTEGILNT
ncbi:hypothetical protein MSSD1_652 [Mycoplasmopsis synoviae]